MDKNTKEFFKAAGKLVTKSIVGVASTTMASPARVKEGVKNLKNDWKRGRLLYKQGYGKNYDSNLKIAKRGKSGPRMIKTSVRGSK